MSSPTPNKNYTYPGHGGAVNSWDSPLNANFDSIDLSFGGTYPITYYSSVTSAPTFNSSGCVAPSTGSQVTISSSFSLNVFYPISGTIASNQTITFPEAGSFYILTNNSSGSFSVTANTAAAAGSAIIPQGFGALVVDDGTNIIAVSPFESALESYLGSPQGNVAGTVATTNGNPTSALIDVSHNVLYTATQTGTTSTTVWTPYGIGLAPQGYLSISSDPNNPIVQAPGGTGSVIQYAPYIGNWTILSNGTTLYPYQFSAMYLHLTTSQAASTVYDIFMYANPTSGIISPVIGTGPAWTSTTARGTGGGTTQLARFNGVWTNANSMSLIYNTSGSGNTTVTVAANEGIYLGSMYMDGSAGFVSCTTGYGQFIKWGVWNCYNRAPIYLEEGDPTSSWTWTGTYGTWRPANNTTANSIIVVSGLPEETYDIQYTSTFVNTTAGAGALVNIGLNTGSAAYGLSGTNNTTSYITVTAKMVLSNTFIGANTLVAVEQVTTAGTATWSGATNGMLLTARYRG